MSKLRIEYQEIPLDRVMRYFMRDYKPEDHEAINELATEWFIDPVKGVVVYKLFVQTKGLAVVP